MVSLTVPRTEIPPNRFCSAPNELSQRSSFDDNFEPAMKLVPVGAQFSLARRSASTTCEGAGPSEDEASVWLTPKPLWSVSDIRRSTKSRPMVGERSVAELHAALADDTVRLDDEATTRLSFLLGE